MEDLEPIKFPLEFGSCPNCGSGRTIADDVLREEKYKGKAGGNIHAFLFQHQSMIKDPSKAVLSAPVIITFYDACSTCGTVRCIHAELKTGIHSPTKPGIGFSTS